MLTLSVGLLLLAMVPSAIDCSDLGEFPIRRGSVMTSWQSSFGDGQTCFYSRSEADETYVQSDPDSSFRFFHSAGKHESDDGFHWFAVQLNEPLPIRSVTVKVREDYSLWLHSRIIGIEVWTSSTSHLLFSGDHCNSRDMSREFNESRHEWRLCSVINRTLGSINQGENITVPCDSANVRYLLLRKNVQNKTNGINDDDVMSFADLHLQIDYLNETDRQSISSISVLRSDNSDSLLDAIVRFTSSARHYEAELRCRADSGSGRSRNLVRLSVSSTLTGSVSLWKLDGNGEQRLDWSNASIECSAVQNQRSRSSPTVLSSATAIWSSRTRLGWSFVTPFALGFSAAAVSVGILIAALVVLGVIKLVTRGPDSTGRAAVPASTNTLADGQAALVGQPDPRTEFENSVYEPELDREVYVTWLPEFIVT